MRSLLFAALIVQAGCQSCMRTASKKEAIELIDCGVAGCPEDRGVAKVGGRLTVHVEAEPATLCDLVEHDAWARRLTENQIFDTLLTEDPYTGALSPRLATLEKTKDAATLTVRRDVKFHDGHALTVDDVIFTLELARDPKLGSDQAADLLPVSKIVRVDDDHVRLELSRPAPFLPSALSHISILPAHLLRGKDLRGAAECRKPVGTGPFKLSEWKPQQEITLRRNDAYWGDKAKLDTIVFRVVRDRQLAFDLHRRGELDLLWRIPTGRSLVDDDRLAGDRVLTWTPNAFYFISYNTEREALAKREVRQALAQLVDRERLRKVGFEGHARDLTGPYLPSTSSYDASVVPWAYAPEKAKAALQSLRGKRLVYLVTAGSRTAEQLGTQLKEALAPLGIELDLQPVDFATLLERLRAHDYDLTSLQLTLALEQDNYGLFHSKGTQNYSDFHNVEADRILDEIRVTVDDSVRRDLEHRLHRLLHEEQPFTFLFIPEVQTLVPRRVHNVRPWATGFNFSQMWVEP